MTSQAAGGQDGAAGSDGAHPTPVAATEHLRRRLTVGLTEQAAARLAVGLDGGTPPAEPPDEALRRLQQGTICDHIAARNAAKGDGAPGAIMLRSKTDGDRNRRKSFDEKDRDENTAQMTTRLNEFGIGIACRKGLKPESPNQDSFAVIISEEGWRVFAVFDGHGPLGHDVSDFAVDILLKLFCGHPDRDEKPEEALTEAFTTVQRLLEHRTRSRTLDSSASGTTCTVAYFPKDSNYVVIAHVGDSRAVLYRAKPTEPQVMETVDLTVDHKPNNPEERRRIEKMGGRVVFDGYYNYRVYSQDGRGGLNMSRALGDCIAHQAGVTEEPEASRTPLDITRRDIAPGQDQFILLCTDGVWEFIESKDACSMVAKHKRDDAQTAVNELTKQSFDNWMQDSDGEVSDDITAVLIWL